MAGSSNHPSVFQEIYDHSYLISRLFPGRQTARHSRTGVYANGVLENPLKTAYHGNSLAGVSPTSFLVQAPSEIGAADFAVDFLMGGVSAAVSETARTSEDFVVSLKVMLVMNECFLQRLKSRHSEP